MGSGASHPAVRAGAVRDTLAFLDKYEAGARERVLARVPAESRRIIESTSRASWIAVEHDHWTIDAMLALFGERRAVECWRESLRELVAGPLLRNFVSGMISVFGRDPGHVVRFFVSGWPLVYRDTCTLRYVEVGGQPAIRFEQIAPEIRQFHGYLHCWNGVCEGFADIAKVQGRVDFRVAADLSWAQAVFFW